MNYIGDNTVVSEGVVYANNNIYTRVHVLFIKQNLLSSPMSMQTVLYSILICH